MRESERESEKVRERYRDREKVGHRKRKIAKEKERDSV